MLQNVIIVFFSEFGRPVKDNGEGTHLATKVTMFAFERNNKRKIVGNHHNSSNLDNSFVTFEINFKTVYDLLLQEKMNFDYSKIRIVNKQFSGLL